MNALQINNISKSYKNYQALEDITFDVKKGTIFGLLGPNGAGKTTLLRITTGIIIADEGEALIDGQKTNLQFNSKKIGYMPEERGLYKKMKAEEQAIYLAQLKGLSYSQAKENAAKWFDKLDMNSWKNKKMEEISKGMGQKLQFVCTVIHQPSIVILDEPFSGLDPMNAEIIKNEIYELSHQGVTIIFSTHRMEQVEEICQKIVLINKGKIILNSTVEEAKTKYSNNEYQIIGSNLTSIEENPIFTTISKDENELILKLNEQYQMKDLLRECSQWNTVEIKKISEKLPNLNEIFIQLVSK